MRIKKKIEVIVYTTIRRREIAVPVHDTLHSVDTDVDFHDIDHCCLNPIISPIPVFFSHPDYKILDLLRNGFSATFLLSGSNAVIFVGNQCPVPAHNCIRGP